MHGLALEIVEGPGSGRLIGVDRSIVLGRDPQSDVVIDDPLVSRRHARIYMTNGSVMVEDLESRNGTLLNGSEVHGPVPVRPGDHVTVGVTVLEARSEEQIARQPSAVRPVPPGLAVPVRAPDYVSPALLRDQPSPLDPLLDVRVKAKARLAPLAIFLVVTMAVLLFLALR